MNTSLAILCNAPTFDNQARSLADQLHLPFLKDQDPAALSDPEFVVLFDEYRVVLQQTGRKAPGPIYVDFTQGDVDHRRKFGGGKGQMIAKAVGIKSGVYPTVLDATAGLGKDSFVLATLGSKVQMLERSPVIFALLKDGLMRATNFAASQDPDLGVILMRMNLIQEDSQRYFKGLPAENFPDVIYLDPMFPDRQKTADVKKEMRAFHSVVGKDDDADALLSVALSCVNYRVVVKRPRKAPFLNGQAPSFQLEGKSSRYDIYTVKKLPDKLNNLFI